MLCNWIGCSVMAAHICILMPCLWFMSHMADCPLPGSPPELYMSSMSNMFLNYIYYFLLYLASVLIVSFSCYLWQFAHWLDGVLLVFSLDNELSFSDVYTNYACLCRFRNMREIPIVIVGTQDAISEKSPRAIDDSRVHQLATELQNCSFHETCAMYGLNIERVFYDGRWLVVVMFLWRCFVIVCLSSLCACSAFTLLVGWWQGHSAHKNFYNFYG